MAFRVNGVEVFGDDATIKKPAITNQRNGSASEVTSADELLVYDNETDDLMRVTVDELFSNFQVSDLSANDVEVNGEFTTVYRNRTTAGTVSGPVTDGAGYRVESYKTVRTALTGASYVEGQNMWESNSRVVARQDVEVIVRDNRTTGSQQPDFYSISFYFAGVGNPPISNKPVNTVRGSVQTNTILTTDRPSRGNFRRLAFYSRGLNIPENRLNGWDFIILPPEDETQPIDYVLEYTVKSWYSTGN